MRIYFVLNVRVKKSSTLVPIKAFKDTNVKDVVRTLDYSENSTN
jgi:hypothetical protein